MDSIRSWILGGLHHSEAVFGARLGRASCHICCLCRSCAWSCFTCSVLSPLWSPFSSSRLHCSLDPQAPTCLPRHTAFPSLPLDLVNCWLLIPRSQIHNTLSGKEFLAARAQPPALLLQTLKEMSSFLSWHLVWFVLTSATR